MIGPECASGHRKLLFLCHCCRDIPPFQLAPQFTFEQHIKGKQRGVCAHACVCGGVIAHMLMDYSGYVLPPRHLDVSPARIGMNIQTVFRKRASDESVLVRKTHFPFL